MQEMINKQYLGGEKEKKKVKKPSEKFRFNFDWEASDDTSRDLNPLYQDPQTALLLFGRGMRAGVDRREQKKSSAAHENELLRRMREAQVSHQSAVTMHGSSNCPPKMHLHANGW